MVVSERKNDPAVSSPLALMTIAELPPGVSLAVARPMYHRVAHRSRTIRNERTRRLLYPSGDYDRAMAVPTIVAMGGGTLDQPYDPTREHFIFSLARRTRPRAAFLGTASGDSEAYTANFFRSVGGLECDATDLPLFQRREAELRRIVLALDVIYVGGGNTLSLLAVWRAHRLDELLREAWEEGIVLCGVSAGINCWFEQSMTDSFAAGTT